MTRKATQPEAQALTIAAISTALITWALIPGLTALPAAALTYLAAVTGAAKLFRLDTTHTLTATNLLLRAHAATAIRATAWTIQALATATLIVLNAIHTKTAADYTVAA